MANLLVCKTYKSQFSMNPQSLQCDCISGFTVEDSCTTMYAYMNVRKKPSLLVQYLKPLQFQDQACLCQDGFELNTLICKCQDLCCDGRVFEVDCDDGNPHDRDGCLIENHFLCYKGSINTSSRCLFLILLSGWSFFESRRVLKQTPCIFIFIVIDWILLVLHVVESADMPFCQKLVMMLNLSKLFMQMVYSCHCRLLRGFIRVYGWLFNRYYFFTSKIQQISYSKRSLIRLPQ